VRTGDGYITSRRINTKIDNIIVIGSQAINGAISIVIVILSVIWIKIDRRRILKAAIVCPRQNLFIGNFGNKSYTVLSL
jgi:FtsH-binding integral membrane protein